MHALTLSSILSVIEAKEGEEYELRASNFPYNKQGKFDGDFYVDGTFVGGFAACYDPQKGEKTMGTTIRGFTATNDAGQSVKRAFKFQKVEIQDKGEKNNSLFSYLALKRLSSTDHSMAEEVSKEKLKHYCSIRLEVYPTFRIGAFYHREVQIKPSRTQRAVPAALAVSEDSKPAFVGVSTG